MAKKRGLAAASMATRKRVARLGGKASGKKRRPKRRTTKRKSTKRRR